MAENDFPQFGQVAYRRAKVPVMEPSTESLRQQLLAARENVQRQIDKLRASPDPLAGVERAPFGAGDVGFDKELIARLTETLREIDESLAGLQGKS